MSNCWRVCKLRQDKSNGVAAVGSAHYYLISRWDRTGCDGTARGALEPVQPPRTSYNTLFPVPARTSRFFAHGDRARSATHSMRRSGKEEERRDRWSLGEESGFGSELVFVRGGCDGCVGATVPRRRVWVATPVRDRSRRAPGPDRREGYSRAQNGYAAVKGGMPHFRHVSFTEFSPPTTRKEWRRARRPL